MGRRLFLVLAVAACGGCLARSGPCEHGGDSDTSSGTVVMSSGVQVARFIVPSVDWWHDVPVTGENRMLLVVVNSDAPSTHPQSVAADGVAMAQLATQSSASYGALSLWLLADPQTGGIHIEVTYATGPIGGLAQSVSFTGVDPIAPVSNITGATRAAGGPFTQTVNTAAGDFPLLLVSWGNNQRTVWLGDEVEVWNETNPGAGASLGGAAATVLGATTEATFAWDDDPGDASGAHLGFSIQAAR